MTIGAAQFREALLERARTLPFFHLIGLDILELEPGRSKTAVTFRPDLTQPAGILHGGVIAAVIDTGIAHAILPEPAIQDLIVGGGHIVSVDLRVKFIRPVSEGRIVCESRVTRFGRQIIHADAVVVNEAGKEVARGDAIYVTVPPALDRAAGGLTEASGALNDAIRSVAPTV